MRLKVLLEYTASAIKLPNYNKEEIKWELFL